MNIRRRSAIVAAVVAALVLSPFTAASGEPGGRLQLSVDRAAWVSGSVPLDFEDVLWAPGGSPRATVFARNASDQDAILRADVVTGSEGTLGQSLALDLTITGGTPVDATGADAAATLSPGEDVEVTLDAAIAPSAPRNASADVWIRFTLTGEGPDNDNDDNENDNGSDTGGTTEEEDDEVDGGFSEEASAGAPTPPAPSSARPDTGSLAGTGAPAGLDHALLLAAALLGAGLALLSARRKGTDHA